MRPSASAASSSALSEDGRMLLNFVTAYNKAQALSVSEKELKQSSREFKDSQASLQLTKSDLSTSMELIPHRHRRWCFLYGLA